ncbi:MAG: RluA family pseudouridine synthase [Verrucomicrobiota bacterium]
MSEEKVEWIVPEGVYKTRADKLLSDAFEGISRADFHRAFDANRVACDGKPIPKNRKVSEGSVIVFTMPEVEECDMTPVDLELDVVHEDEHMIVVNKPVGLVVHPGAGQAEATLAHGLLFHCKGQLSGIGGVERPGIVHRLDRETSGLIMAAKTDQAHRALSELFQSRNIRKEYAALVTGKPDLLSGSVIQNIERHPTQRHKMRACKEDSGRFAHTDWKFIKPFDGYSLVHCRIHTGRTHQIRVHMNYLKHPILGDPTYGYRKQYGIPIDPPRVMLHSKFLEFMHPITNERLELEAKEPEDFRPFLERAID